MLVLFRSNEATATEICLYLLMKEWLRQDHMMKMAKLTGHEHRDPGLSRARRRRRTTSVRVPSARAARPTCGRIGSSTRGPFVLVARDKTLPTALLPHWQRSESSTPARSTRFADHRVGSSSFLFACRQKQMALSALRAPRGRTQYPHPKNAWTSLNQTKSGALVYEGDARSFVEWKFRTQLKYDNMEGKDEDETNRLRKQLTTTIVEGLN